MATRHLHEDSLRLIAGIHHWMRVRRRFGCGGRARARDRSATARPCALDSTTHVLGKKLLRALLARLQMQPHPRSGRLGRASRCRGAGEGRDRQDAVKGANGTRLAERARGSAPVALRQHRVRERELPENAGHAAARPVRANRVDDESGSRNVPIPIPRTRALSARGVGASRLRRGPERYRA